MNISVTKLPGIEAQISESRPLDVLKLIAVFNSLSRSLAGHPAYGASSELIDLFSGRAETTSHTTHPDSEATTHRITSCT